MVARQLNLALDSPIIGQGPVCLKADKASIIIPGIEMVFGREKLVQEKFSHCENRSESLQVGMLKRLSAMGNFKALILQGYKDKNK